MNKSVFIRILTGMDGLAGVKNICYLWEATVSLTSEFYSGWQRASYAILGIGEVAMPISQQPAFHEYTQPDRIEYMAFSKKQKRPKRFKKNNKNVSPKTNTFFNVGYVFLILSIVGMALPILFGKWVWFGNLGNDDPSEWFLLLLVFIVLVYWIYKTGADVDQK
jgi:hypothetical protein